MLSGFQVETQEPLLQRSSKSSTASMQLFSMNSLALKKSGSKATPKQIKFCYMLISQDPTSPLWFLSGQLSISSVQGDNSSLLTDRVYI